MPHHRTPVRSHHTTAKPTGVARPLVALLALAVLVGVPTAPFVRAEATPVVIKDEANDFQWTLPDGWTSQPVSETDRASGYRARARRTVGPGQECYANVLVVDAAGNDVDTLISQSKGNREKNLTDVESSDDLVVWAGVSGARALTISGLAKGGGAAKFFLRGVVAGTRYHELSIVSSNGAHEEIQSEVDAALDGYQLLSAPPPGTGPEGGGAAGADRPLVKKFEHLGLTWTIPPGGRKTLPPVKDDEPERVWEWGFANAGNPALKPGESGLLAVALLNFNGENLVRMELELPAAERDIDPAAIVRNERNFEGLKKEFDGEPVPNIDVDTKVGNARGAYFTFAGKDAETKKGLYYRFYFVTLQQQLFRMLVVAHQRAETTEADFLRAAMNGLVWGDASTGIRGPIAAPFRTATGERKDWRDLGTDKKIESPLKLKKPKEFGGLSVQNAAGYVFAAETRKAGAYLFVGIVRENAEKIGAGTPPWSLQSLVNDHENQWKTEVTDPITRGKGEKANAKDGALKTGKGLVYEFRGSVDGNPIVEKGWVVKASKDIFWIRAQFAGVNADKVLEKEWKSLVNSIGFN